MPKPKIRRPLPLLLALSLAPLLTSCGQDRPRLALPPIERAAQVDIPPAPAGNSDAEVAALIAAYDQALRTANGRLGWLGDWIGTAGK